MALSRQPASRFQIRQGKMTLSLPPLPDLGCLVTELDENGCRGRVLFQYVPLETATAWRRALTTRKGFHVFLDIPPVLFGFQIAVTVLGCTELSGHTELDMTFDGIGATEKSLLQQSILTLATLKVRGATVSPSESGESAAAPSPPPMSYPTASPSHPPPVLSDVPPTRAPSLAPVAPAPAPPPQIMRAAITMPSQPQADNVRDTSSLLKLKKIGEVLMHMGQLKPEQIQQAVIAAKQNNERFGTYLVRMNLVSAEVLCRALALQSGLPMTDLSDCEVPEKVASQFTHATMLRHEFVPFDEAKTFVCVAAANPLKGHVVKELETLCGKKVEVFIAEEEKVLKLLDSVHIKQQRKQRKHVRYDVSLPVKYQFCSRLGTPSEAVVHTGLTVNLSEGGMLIEGSPSALGTPEELRRRGICVSIDFPHVSGKDIHAICQLRAVREKEKHVSAEPRWLIGVELVDMSVEDRRRLKEICVKAVMSLQKKHGRQSFE